MTGDRADRRRRVIAAAAGVLCLMPTALITASVLRDPTGPRLTVVAILLLGAVGGPALLTRWNRWPTLAGSTRLAAVFASAYLTPFVLALLGRFSRPSDVLTVNLPFAAGIAALWWARQGRPAQRPPVEPPPHAPAT